MAKAYTQRLVVHRTSAAFSGIIYTNVWPGTTIIRDVVLHNLHSAPQVLGLFLTSTQGENIWLIRKLAVPTGESLHVDLRQELEVGETLSMSTDLGPASIAVTAYVLT